MSPLPPLSLYIHFPWCERKCPYCDFNSHESTQIPFAEYVQVLLADLDVDLEQVPGREVHSIFIGGGTPSLFPADAIAQLLLGIRARLALSPQLEVTLEANPGSAEAEKFLGFREAGVTRLSLGIQSFHNSSLRALGRIHDTDQAHKAIAYAQTAGFDSINLDLMHGLPGQTVDTALRDLETAIACNTAHLSWYQLTIEANTVFYKQPPQLPVENILADIQQSGEAMLAAAGLSQYEVSAYAKTGSQCQHNRNYWLFGDYLGIGAGAHGKLSFSDGSVKRMSKKRQPADFMAALPNNFVADTRELDAADRVGEFIMNALRLNEGFSLALFEERTGLPGSSLEPCLSSMIERQLLEMDAGQIKATGFGRRFLDNVIVEFLD